jgi:glycosyltransferase involved in cell wall biosynthesis
MILTMKGGGAERQLAYLAPELSRLGHDVHLAFVCGGLNSERLAGSGVQRHHLTASAKYDPLLVAKAFGLVRHLRPHVLHTWLTHMDIIGGGAARALRVPWVMSERSAALSYPPTLLNRVRVAAGRRADLIVPNSEGGAAYWMTNGVPRSRIEVIPNFVPLAEMESADRLDDCRFADDDELVIHVGRLSPEKNLRVLVSSLPHLFRARPRAKFAFCGDGPMFGELTAQVRDAGLDARVIFAGFVQGIASWLKRSSAVVSISRCEGHPNAVLEAIAVGVPVVVSDIPAYRSILSTDAAFFIGGDDAVAIGAAIVRALEDRPEAESRATRARAALAAQSIEAAATRYEGACRRAIDVAASRHRTTEKGAG